MVFKKKKASRRKSFSKKSRSKRSSSFGSSNVMNDVIGGAIYGASRQTLVNYLVTPLSDKLPVAIQPYADNIILLGVNYAIAKGKVPVLSNVKFLRNAAKSGMAIESALVGVDLVNNFMPSSNTSQSTNTSW